MGGEQSSPKFYIRRILMLEVVYKVFDLVNDYIISCISYIQERLYDIGVFELEEPLQMAICFFDIAIVVGIFALFFYLVFILIRAIFRLFWG